ncbi:MAG: DUF3857 domain-containing protein [Bacteroidia bacterium]
MKRLSLFCLIFGLLISTFSQNISIDRTPPLKLHKVADSWVDQDKFALAPEAEAIILSDNGALYVVAHRTKLRFLYHYQRTIKIVKQAGVDACSEIHIDYGADEDLINVIARTHRRYNPNAKVVTIKVTQDMMEEQELGGGKKRRTIRFPKLAPGTVITYAYAIAVDDYSRTRPWNFRAKWPIVHSQFESHIPESFVLMAIIQGERGNLEVKESNYEGYLHFKSVKNAQTEPRIQATITGVGLPDQVSLITYQMKNMLPAESGAFLTKRQERMFFQLQGIYTVNNINGWALNWEDFAQFAARHSRIGALTRDKQVIRNWLKSQGLSLEEKPGKDHLSTLISIIQDNMTWDGGFDALASQTTRELLKSGSGNSADINLLTAAVLNTFGYKVRPMLTCTRKYGYLLQEYPVLAQFNHVVLEVKLKGKTTILDPREPRLPVGMIAVNQLRNEAFRIGTKKSSWVSLNKGITRHRHTLAFFDLNPQTGTIQGKLRHIDRGYSALKTQTVLARYEENLGEYFQEEMLAEFPAAKMKEHIIRTEQRGEDEAIYTRVEFATKDYISGGDSLILIEPLLSEAYPENPLAGQDKTKAVDFGSPVKEEFILLLTIPDGYEFSVIPEISTIALPNGNGRFIYRYQVVNQTLQLLSRIEIKRSTFPPSYRDALSQFFDYIAAKHGERVIVKKL